MKKLLIMLALIPTVSFSAPTGTLVIQGVIPSLRSLTVTTEPGFNNLDLSTSQTDLKIATVKEKSNSMLGYKTTITSSNLGNLKRNGGTELIPYSLKYNGSVANITTALGHSVTSVSFPVNVNKDLSISYTGVDIESLTEGTYSDTLTLSISSP